MNRIYYNRNRIYYKEKKYISAYKWLRKQYKKQQLFRFTYVSYPYFEFYKQSMYKSELYVLESGLHYIVLTDTTKSPKHK